MSLPAVLRLKNAPRGEITDSEREELIMRVAAGVPGRDMLFRLLDPDGERVASISCPAEEAVAVSSDTDRAIDTFLATYGRMSPREEALLEKMIFNPVPDDYAALLEREAAAEGAKESGDSSGGSDNSDSSDKGVRAVPTRAARPVHTVPPATDSGASLSESLAQVYIRRGRYDKAYDIIHALSLNNPKKSVYFADQLRFLQKLMLIERASKGGADEPNNV